MGGIALPKTLVPGSLPSIDGEIVEAPTVSAETPEAKAIRIHAEQVARMNHARTCKALPGRFANPRKSRQAHPEKLRQKIGSNRLARVSALIAARPDLKRKEVAALCKVSTAVVDRIKHRDRTGLDRARLEVANLSTEFASKAMAIAHNRDLSIENTKDVVAMAKDSISITRAAMDDVSSAQPPTYIPNQQNMIAFILDTSTPINHPVNTQNSPIIDNTVNDNEGKEQPKG